MLSKHGIFKLISYSHATIINSLPVLSSSSALCTTTESLAITESPDGTESPELPDWLKTPEMENTSSTADSDEDFVIPSLASWVENRKVDVDHNKVAKHLPSEQGDNDINEISKTLREWYPSHDKVVQALNKCGVTVSNGLVSQALKRFSNDWKAAFGIFTWAKSQAAYRHTPELCNSMVDVLGKSNKFDLMWDLVEEMNQSSGYVSLDTMSKVMRRLARAGRYNDAIKTFRELERFGVNKDTVALNMLMDALAKENSVEHASEVFLEFKDCIPCNSHTFNILINGYCKIGKFEEARKTMDDMDKHGFHPDVVSYTNLIEAYCHEKDFRKVDAILEEMQKKSCKPNAITYTIIMHALGKARQITEALEIYEKMKHNGCLPDTSFYSSLIFILSKAGRLKDASEVFEDMTAQGVPRDVLTYNTMISSACIHSQEETALKLLQRMEEDSCKPNLKTYAPLLKMCCRKKRMKVLSFLLHHMFKNDVSIDLGTYALLVRGLCKSGKLERACLFFEETVSKGMVPMDCTYKLLVEELERKGMTDAKGRIKKLVSQVK